MRKLTIRPELIAYREHAVDNELDILSSKECCCFFCRSIFNARKISDWIIDERGCSAVCPECGMDSVIGDSTGFPKDKALLKEMNLAFYGEDYMDEHPEALHVYCSRYLEGKIAHKPHNEDLFIKYLTQLYERGDARASLCLGRIYESGTEFSEPDINGAYSIYRAPCLKSNPEALCRLGALHIQYGIGGQKANRLGFEAFAKASALGSLEAAFHLADCYLTGTYVKPDARFAFETFTQIFPEVLEEFAETRQNYDLFAQFSYHMAKCYQYGLGTRKDSFKALRFYLYARLAFQIRNMEAKEFTSPTPIEEDLFKEINQLAPLFKAISQEPIYDQDSFYDSFSELQESHLPKKFTLTSFDEDSGELEFDVDYVRPPLIIDVASLYCGFVNGPIHWRFTGVAYFKIFEGDIFHKVGSPDGDRWSFVCLEGKDKETTMAELRFYADTTKDNPKDGDYDE